MPNARGGVPWGGAFTHPASRYCGAEPKCCGAEDDVGSREGWRFAGRRAVRGEESAQAMGVGVTPNGARLAAPPSAAVSTQMPFSCTATLCSQ